MANQYLPGVNIIPNSLVITSITNSMPMQVTVTLVNNAPNPRVNTYKPLMNVKLYVPRPYGMYQANGLVGNILGISGNTFTLDLDSTLFDTFSIPMTITESPASFSPSGSKNLQYDNTNVDFVPFKSLNNIGN